MFGRQRDRHDFSFSLLLSFFVSTTCEAIFVHASGDWFENRPTDISRVIKSYASR